MRANGPPRPSRRLPPRRAGRHRLPPVPVAGAAALVVLLAAGWAAAAPGHADAGVVAPGAGEALSHSPIKHVVVLFQENHSFNDLLGRLCVDEGDRCKGTTEGELSDGTKMALRPEPDIVPTVGHLFADQVAAMNHGAMNGWDHVDACGARNHYHCLTQAEAGAVPTLWSLADTYAISDRTFESSVAASWGSHIELVAGTSDGFQGDPYRNVGSLGKGNACEGQTDAFWFDRTTQHMIQVPACIPDANGNGPYRASPVPYVPTIMDRMEAAGLSWRIYAPGRKSRGGGYGWSICPTFYECDSTGQRHKVVSPHEFVHDAQSGNLPALSLVIPLPRASQHNGNSLMKGDNWIAENVDAVMANPNLWKSTAIFITYDDCGCFYDAVRPPAGFGIRVPMVIVSPYAKPGFVDHSDASFASLLAFTEHTFGLPPLPGGMDGNAYDYADAFSFADSPRPPIALPQHRVPASSIAWLATHLPPDDDPT